MRLRCDLALRFDYGLVRPRVRRQDDVLLAIAGPDLLAMRAPVALECSDDGCLGAEFTVDAGQKMTFVMSYGPSHCPRARGDRCRSGAGIDPVLLARLGRRI